MPATRPRFTPAYLLNRLSPAGAGSNQILRTAGERQLHLARLTKPSGQQQ